MTPSPGFWQQPCEGLSGAYRPVTDAALDAKQIELGAVFPHTFRTLYQQQNGGHVRFRSHFKDGSYHALFINGGTLCPLQEICGFRENLLGFMDDDDVDAATATADPCHLDRLIILSFLDGHALLCLDYGWDQAERLAQPRVVSFDQDDGVPLGYTETLRVGSWQSFVDELVYAGYECDGFFVGISGSGSLDELVDGVGDALDAHLVERTDDRYGWFDFDRYFIGDAKGGGCVVVSHNAFRSGTFRFHTRPDTPWIVEWIAPLDACDEPVDLSEPVAALIRTLGAQGWTAEPLLSPHRTRPAD